jgi:hypothetical protein
VVASQKPQIIHPASSAEGEKGAEAETATSKIEHHFPQISHLYFTCSASII